MRMIPFPCLGSIFHKQGRRIRLKLITKLNIVSQNQNLIYDALLFRYMDIYSEFQETYLKNN